MDKRVSELMPLDQAFSEALTKETSAYVCSHCQTPDPDPYAGFLNGKLVVYCPRCRLESIESAVAATHEPLLTRNITGFKL